MPHIPSNDEIVQLLDQLESRTADDLESEVLEFQLWEPSIQKNVGVAVECAVCFGNAMGGVIIFGVRNNVKGRKNAITGCSGYDCERLRQHIYESTKPSLNCAVEEIQPPEGTLVVVRVPPAPTRPCGTTGGLFKVRIGKTCRPLDPSAFGEARDPPVSAEEATLLRLAAEHTGDIHEIELDGRPFIRVEGVQDLYDMEDNEARAKFLDALENLVVRGHVRHQGGILYSLTRSGWDAGRRLGAVGRQTRELIRRQALARFVREQERIAGELPALLSGRLAEFIRAGQARSSLAAGAAAECILSTIKAIAQARIEAEFAALQEAGVPLDHARGEALKAGVSEMVNKATEDYLEDRSRLWRARLRGFESAVAGRISQRSENINLTCVRDIDIALNAALLKS